MDCKPVGPGGGAPNRQVLQKIQMNQKEPSNALSKTTTLTRSSVSIFLPGLGGNLKSPFILCGKKHFRGGPEKEKKKMVSVGGQT